MRKSLILTAALGMTAMGANAQNLVENGSFEVEGPGFLQFADWVNFGNVFAADSGEIIADDGLISAKMFGASSGIQSDQVLQQTFDGANAGELYTLSASVQNLSIDALGAENIILIQMVFRDAADQAIEAVETTAIDPVNDPLDEWVESSVSGIAPAGTDNILISLLHIQLGTDAGFPDQGGGASFWDSISLVGGDTPCTNPADFNGDGVLDFFDVSAFLEAFGDGCP